MDIQIQKDYADGVRQLLISRGSIVEISEQERERWPDSPDFWVSTYGWKDYEASKHVLQVSDETAAKYSDYERCALQIPAGVQVEEVTYSEFQDTFSDNANTVGINAYGGPKGSDTEIQCSCGKYRGLTVRYEGTFQEALHTILGIGGHRPKFVL